MLALLFVAALSSPQAHHWYQYLLAEGGYGRIDRECAAFLIRERDGTLTLMPWPEGGFRHATYRGAIPPGVIAILHTHPADEPQPSARDRALARRLGIPVVVITPDGVIAAEPTGARTPVLSSETTRDPSVPRTVPRR